MAVIRFVNSFSWDTHHKKFNAALLKMCSLISSKVEYIGGQRLDIADADNIVFSQINVLHGNSRFALFGRYIFSGIKNIIQLVKAPEERLLVYNCNNLFFLRTFNRLNKCLKKKVVIFCHGEMELLVANTQGKGLLHKILTRLARRFFLNKKVILSPYIHFFVMGTTRNNLAGVLDENKLSHFHTLDHSYIFEDYSIEPAARESKLKTGTAGVFSGSKGGDSLLELDRILKEQGINNVELSVTGHIIYPLVNLLKAGIKLPPDLGAVPLAENDYAQRINSLDYILFLYPPQTYKLTASGAVMDAINARRPIVGLKNEYFSYLFDKYGKFGYLADNITELAGIIRELSQGNRPEEFDFDSIRKRLSPDVISGELYDRLHKIGFI